MTKEFDTLVTIMRMQPFHKGHEAVIRKGLEHADEVIVVAGSCFEPRTIDNPFTFEERKDMVKAVFPEDNVKVVPSVNFPYNDNAWVAGIQDAVNSVKTGKRTGLIGHSKDSSSYYLKIFPDWRNHIEVENVEGINATDIRRAFFTATLTPAYISKSMPDAAYNSMIDVILANGKIGGWWDELCLEYIQIQAYKDAWKVAPYAPTFVTTDAVLTQSGYILLIRRGGFPYKNCWALPGGYLAGNISIADNMIKELREETGVKIPSKVLMGSVKGTQVFDMPSRDPRGRTITHAFHIDLGFPNERLPKVVGADDAAEAKWFKLSEVTRDMMAFDHFSIIRHFIPSH